MDRLGPVAALVAAAIDLELTLKRYDAALARVDAAAARSPHPEAWLARRGEILEAAGRGHAAREAYAQALREIESRPPHRRATRSVQNLETRLRTALDGSRGEGGHP
jgi:predicted negative regulator of RcsB-dependent stress response